MSSNRPPFLKRKKKGVLLSQKPQGPIPRQRFTGEDGERIERCRAVGGTHRQLRANGELTLHKRNGKKRMFAKVSWNQIRVYRRRRPEAITQPTPSPHMIYMVTSPVVYSCSRIALSCWEVKQS